MKPQCLSKTYLIRLTGANGGEGEKPELASVVFDFK